MYKYIYIYVIYDLMSKKRLLLRYNRLHTRGLSTHKYSIIYLTELSINNYHSRHLKLIDNLNNKILQ